MIEPKMINKFLITYVSLSVLVADINSRVSLLNLSPQSSIGDCEKSRQILITAPGHPRSL